MRCEPGKGDIIIKHWLSSPPGFWLRKPDGGKKWTPAITVPQLAIVIAWLLHNKLGADQPRRIYRTARHRLRRNEQAMFYHWKTRKRLAPIRVNQRK